MLCHKRAPRFLTRNYSEQETKKMHTKRFCSHILPLLMIPFVIVFMAVWYQIVLWILSLLERVPFLMKLLNCMDGILQDAAGLGILGLLATVIINWIVQALIDCSQKLCPSAKRDTFHGDRHSWVCGSCSSSGFLLFESECHTGSLPSRVDPNVVCPVRPRRHILFPSEKLHLHA